MQLIDLTHTFKAPMPVYPGDLVPEFLTLASIKLDGVADTQVSTGMHVGTHIDAPAHMIAGGKTLDQFSVDRFVGRGVLVDARQKSHINAALLRTVELRVGDLVLVLTGWSQYFGQSLRAQRSNPMHQIATARGPRDDAAIKDYFADYPVVDESFAQKLVEAGVSLVGFDMPSPDTVEQDPDPSRVGEDEAGNLYPIHHLLLEADMLIAENVNHLDQLANVGEFEVIALPVKFATEGAPARIIARV